MSPDLPSDVPHRRIDADDWTDIYVVGDVHGCRRTLDRLLDRLAPTDDDLVVFVGDLVRKGPDSAGVLDRVRDRPNLVSVRGNNERKLVDGEESPEWLTDDYRDYVASLPVAVSWDDALVVHGGVDHRKPLSDHTRDELLTARSLAPEGGYARPLWFETRRERPRVFFGHTVLSEPFETAWAVGLDTGCVHGGALTAYDCSAGEFVAVTPETTHRSRSANDIVDPRLAPQSTA